MWIIPVLLSLSTKNIGSFNPAKKLPGLTEESSRASESYLIFTDAPVRFSTCRTKSSNATLPPKLVEIMSGKNLKN